MTHPEEQLILSEAGSASKALEKVAEGKQAELDTTTLNRLEELGLVTIDLQGNAEVVVFEESSAEIPDYETLLEKAGDIPQRVIIAIAAEKHRSLRAREKSLLPLDVGDHSTMGKFIKSHEDNPETQGRYLRALIPFLESIKTIRSDLKKPSSNKLFVKVGEEAEEWRLEMLRKALAEGKTHIGNDESEDIAWLDISAILDVDTAHISFPDANPSRVLFDVLRYALTGKTSPLLTKRKKWRVSQWWAAARGRGQNTCILDDLRHPDHPCAKLIETVQNLGDKKAVLVVNDKEPAEPIAEESPLAMMMGETFTRKTAKDVLEMLNLKPKADKGETLDADFLEAIGSTPMILIADEEYDTSRSTKAAKSARNITIEDDAFNDVAVEAMGFSETEREKMKVENLRTGLVKILSPAGADNADQFEESLMAEYGRAGVREALTYLFTKAESINGMKLAFSLASLTKQGIYRIPLEVKRHLTEVTGLSSDLITRFETCGRNFQKVAFTEFPDKSGFTELTVPFRYMSSGEEVIGVEKETDEVVAALCAGQSVALDDMTHFEESALPRKPKKSVTMNQRVQANLLKRIMEGQVPPHLRQATLVEFARLPEYIKKMFAAQGYEIDDRAGFDIQSQIQALKQYNENTIIIVRGDEIEEADRLNTLAELIEQEGLQVVVTAQGMVPGMRNIHIPNITEESLEQRIDQSRDEIKAQIGLPISDETLKMVVDEVNAFRNHNQDPLQLVTQILLAAAAASRSVKNDHVSKEAVIQALAFTFNKPDASKAIEIEKIFDQAPDVVKKYIAGLDEPIAEVLDLVKNHLQGAGEADKPLCLMIPGPTGVGKTLFVKTIAKHLGLPLLAIDGTNYTSKSSLSRLIGSDREYHGESEGLLTKFLDAHPQGIIFIDELDKFHPEIRQHLMNFFDTGKIEDGNGKTFHRPAMSIISATNAGASDLRPGQNKGDLQKIVAKSFRNERGQVQLEETKRFTIVPFFEIYYDDFLESIEKEVQKLNFRTAYQIFGISIQGITPDARDAIFEMCKSACTFLNAEPKPPHDDELAIYYNMREVSRVINQTLSAQVSGIIRDKSGIDLVLEDDESDQEKALLDNNQTFTSETYWIDMDTDGELRLTPPQLH